MRCGHQRALRRNYRPETFVTNMSLPFRERVCPLLAALCIWPASALTQQMYRCGNTFSQQPCGPDATAIKSQGVLQPPAPDVHGHGEKVERMKALCREALIRVPAWKDRDSLKIGPVHRGSAEVRTIGGSPQVVRTYATTINSKNSYGAYEGEKAAACYVNEHETKVLDIFTPS
jgi:hypothetical protein